jgi:hypothetical protein
MTLVLRSLPARERGDCTMARYARRLAALERALRPHPIEKQISEIAFLPSGEVVMFAGQEWLPCPNAAELLARKDLAISVYGGMTLEMLIGPTKPRSTDAGDRSNKGAAT